MKHPSSRVASLLLVVLLLASLAASCVMPVPPVETPAPVATDTPQPVPGDLAKLRADCAKQSKLGKELQARLPDPSTQAAQTADLAPDSLPQMQRPPFQGLIYVEGEVLLTGHPDEIQKITEELQLKLGINKDVPPITLGQGQVIQLATTARGQSVEETVCLFNTYAQQTRPGSALSADPNYFMSPAGWRGGGSPWTQNGYWASQQPGGGLGLATRAQFLNQWALGQGGIALMDDGNRVVEPTGKDVTIAVLDTSPWKLRCPGGWPCSQKVSLESLTGNVLGQPAVGAPDMTVWELEPANGKTCPGQDAWNEELDRESQNINNHGLFAASLAHVVAPQSKIHLLRVLEDDGCGDLGKVLQGLEQFEQMMTQQAKASGAEDELPLANTVINLSLGVHHPENAVELALPAEVTTLQAKLQHMMSLGAVVVAAAGNDSFAANPDAKAPGDPGAPLEAEVPARDPQVIGVAASTVDKARGCFSNSGAVGAPGGNGLKLELVPPNPELTAEAAAADFTNCIVPGQVDPGSTAYWCENAGNEDACLIGLGIDPFRRTPRYLYWVGTSFATPLVSGIAALRLEEGVPPDQVDDEIYARVDPATAGAPFLGAGIANAAN